jgi:hypothetical protein
VAEPIAAYPTDPITEYPTDPDKMPAVPWMTWIPSRRPEFKVHTDVGKAKSALGIQEGRAKRLPDGGVDYPVRGGVLYQLVNDKWHPVAIVQPGSLKKDNLMFRHPRKWNKAPGITTVIPEHPYEV